MAIKGTVVDVRTRAEYSGGHVKGSVNIPLQEITSHIEEIKAMEQPIIFCCASGGRSGQATQYFKSLGVNCENGGSWLDVNYQMSL
ncbi:MAG: rhodanese-like domain-containing protein [Crocinitomicaceae bacterium]|jgi:rhodanese-related sulfurtransferase